MRIELLKFLYEVSKCDIEFSQFAINLGEWELVPVIVDDEVIAVMIEREGEIHLAIKQEPVAQSRPWREYLSKIVQPIIDKHGFVTTRIPSNDKEAIRFATRLGFKRLVFHGQIETFVMSQIKHRRRKCHSSQ